VRLPAGGGTEIEGEALEPSAVLSLGLEDLRQFVKAKPRLAWNLIETLSWHADFLEGKLELLAFRSVPERLATLLVRLTARRTEIQLSHQKLAEGIGASREAVTRALDAFRAQGLVELSRSSIRIVDADALVRLSAGATNEPSA
jgi:CRP-like cAMP-binding protein